MFMFAGEITCVSIAPLCHYGFHVNPGLINPAKTAVLLGEYHKIKGPDNPTSQLLPKMSFNGLAGTGKEGKTKEVVKDREGKMVCMYVCNVMYVCMYYDILCHVPKNSQLQKNSAHVPTTTKHGTFTPVTRPQRNGHCSNTKRYKT